MYIHRETPDCYSYMAFQECCGWYERCHHHRYNRELKMEARGANFRCIEHHKFTDSEKDPDLGLTEAFPTSRQSLIRKFLRDLSGIAGFRRYSAVLISAWGKENTIFTSKPCTLYVHNVSSRFEVQFL